MSKASILFLFDAVPTKQVGPVHPQNSKPTPNRGQFDSN